MTDTTAVPDYLKSALSRLDAARTAHLDNARRMDETTAAISQVKAQKMNWCRKAAMIPVHGVLPFVPVAQSLPTS